MKKMLCSTISAFLLFSAAMPAYCADTHCADTQTQIQILDLVHDGLDKHLNQIEQMSISLTDEQRALIYQASKKDATAPMLANLAIGFGVGSGADGNTAAGIGQLMVELIGVGGGLSSIQ